MRIVEDTSERLVLRRGAWVDKAIFLLVISIGIGLLVLGRFISDFPTWGSVFLGLLFVGVGSYFLFRCAHVTLTFDRDAGSARLDWAGSPSARTTLTPLADIMGVAADGDVTETARLVLELRDARRVPLTPYQYTGGDHPAICARLNAWLADAVDAEGRP